MRAPGSTLTRWVTGVAAVLLLLPLAACTGGGSSAAGATGTPSTGARTLGPTTPSSPSTTSPAGPASSGPEPALGPSFPAGTTPAGGPAQAGAGADGTAQAAVSLRMDTHPGYGRVELVLNTSGVAEWSVAYSDKTGPGGTPVSIAGDAVLRVVLKTGTQSGGQSGSQGSSSVTSSGVIAGVRTLGTVNGAQEVLIGISGGQLPFRALALTDPGRIVIDVRTQ